LALCVVRAGMPWGRRLLGRGEIQELDQGSPAMGPILHAYGRRAGKVSREDVRVELISANLLRADTQQHTPLLDQIHQLLEGF